MTRIVVIAPPSFAPLRLLQDVDYVASDDPAVLREEVRHADAIVVAMRFVPILRDLLPYAERLRWLHALPAGVDTLPFDALRERGVVVTNSRGLYADALAEFALTAMLWFARDLRRLADNQRAAKWEPFLVERLEGKSVGIIGYGGIGRAVGRRAEAMGMRVGTARRREGDVDALVRESDYVVLSTPLTPSTTGLMRAERIAAMRPVGVLINISRGAVVDEAALVEALRARRIRGAALDVFQTEPLPPDHPLWTLDNVLISPHSADRTPDSHDRAMRFFLENLRRFERGAELENVVDLTERY